MKFLTEIVFKFMFLEHRINHTAKKVLRTSEIETLWYMLNIERVAALFLNFLRFQRSSSLFSDSENFFAASKFVRWTKC